MGDRPYNAFRNDYGPYHNQFIPVRGRGYHPNPYHPNPFHPNPFHPNPFHPNPFHSLGGYQQHNQARGGMLNNQSNNYLGFEGPCSSSSTRNPQPPFIASNDVPQPSTMVSSNPPQVSNVNRPFKRYFGFKQNKLIRNQERRLKKKEKKLQQKEKKLEKKREDRAFFTKEELMQREQGSIMRLIGNNYKKLCVDGKKPHVPLRIIKQKTEKFMQNLKRIPTNPNTIKQFLTVMNGYREAFKNNPPELKSKPKKKGASHYVPRYPIPAEPKIP